MKLPAARFSDLHICPMITGVIPHVGGPVVQAICTNVLIGSLPPVQLGCQLVCTGPPDIVMAGSTSVLVGGLPVARLGDKCAHGGVLVSGFPTVIIG